MQTLVIISRAYVIFLAVFGFIFGQLFAGDFNTGPTLAGLFGLVSGLLGGQFALKTRTRSQIIILCCVISLLGVGLDAYHYYAYLNSSGNYYAWFLIAPFSLFLIVLIARLYKNMPNK